MTIPSPIRRPQGINMTIVKKCGVLLCAAGFLLVAGCAGSLGVVQDRLSSAINPLTADGSGDIYQSIKDQGYNYEVPDDPNWGNHHEEKHITREFDSFLNKTVFALHIHYNDNVKDTWVNSNARGGQINDLANSQQVDRQRNELKTDNNSPEWGKAKRGHSVIYRWKFKLPADLVGSSNFTHIHQLKAVGGDESQPIISLSVRKRSSGVPPQEMQLIYRYASDSAIDRNRYLLEKILLDDFLAEWIAVEEKVTYDEENPVYEFTAVRMRDEKTLMHYVYDANAWTEEVPFRTYRRGNNFVRPKWGIYRQILRNEDGKMVEVVGPLHDDTVLFADIEIETFVERR